MDAPELKAAAFMNCSILRAKPFVKRFSRETPICMRSPRSATGAGP